jgi:hypothetical protein
MRPPTFVPSVGTFPFLSVRSQLRHGIYCQVAAGIVKSPELAPCCYRLLELLAQTAVRLVGHETPEQNRQSFDSLVRERNRMPALPATWAVEPPESSVHCETRIDHTVHRTRYPAWGITLFASALGIRLFLGRKTRKTKFRHGIIPLLADDQSGQQKPWALTFLPANRDSESSSVEWRGI